MAAAMASKLMHAVQYDCYGGGASGLKVLSFSTCLLSSFIPAVILAFGILLTA